MLALLVSLAATAAAQSPTASGAPGLAFLDGNPEFALCAVIGEKLAAAAQGLSSPGC